MTVTIAVVGERPFPEGIAVTGPIAARQDVAISAPIPGQRVTAILVNEGQIVRKGAVLARTDAAVLEAQSSRAAANVQDAEAAAREAKAAYDRVAPIRSTGAVSGEMVDQRHAQAVQAAARLSAARAEARELAARLDQTIIRAPVAGRIAKRSIEVGATVGAEPIFHIIANDEVEFVAQAPAAQLARISPEDKVVVTLSNGEAVEGRVRAVSAALSTDTRLGSVYVTLPRRTAVRPGDFARGEIATGGERTAIAAPTSATRFEDGRASVFIVDAQDIVRRRAIETGVQDGAWIAVPRGLAAGERVVAQSAAFLHDGMRVATAPPAPGKAP